VYRTTLRLTDLDKEMLDQAVSDGHYSSLTEAVRDAIRHLPGVIAARRARKSA